MALARPTFKNVGLTSWNHVGSEDNDDDDDEDDEVDNNNDRSIGNNINKAVISSKNQQCKGGGPRYLVAIWGDEGLDMPLSLPCTPSRGIFYNCEDDEKEKSSSGGGGGSGAGVKNAEWLAQLVNERHTRNCRSHENLDSRRRFCRQ
jgi:hypothetical protein